MHARVQTVIGSLRASFRLLTLQNDTGFVDADLGTKHMTVSVASDTYSKRACLVGCGGYVKLKVLVI